MVKTQPSLFVPHGAPDLTLTDHVAKRFMQKLGDVLEKSSSSAAKGIVVISAHWQTELPIITTGPDLETIYDFYGFPKQLHSIVYPAKTSPWLIKNIEAVFNKADITFSKNNMRGLDHGAWTPLRLMYPDAQIPIVQLSLGAGKNADYHLQLGKILAPLREQGILIIGSGSITHNLSALGVENSNPPGWAKHFDQWISDKLLAHDISALLEFHENAPDAYAAHPTDEHLMPLFVALGAGLDAGGIKQIHKSFSCHSISMSGFAFGEGDILDNMTG